MKWQWNKKYVERKKTTKIGLQILTFQSVFEKHCLSFPNQRVLKQKMMMQGQKLWRTCEYTDKQEFQDSGHNQYQHFCNLFPQPFQIGVQLKWTDSQHLNWVSFSVRNQQPNKTDLLYMTM